MDLNKHARVDRLVFRCRHCHMSVTERNLIASSTLRAARSVDGTVQGLDSLTE
jgi:hypothetical protein